MAVNKKLKGIYNFIFEGFETKCANLISDFFELKYRRQYINKKTIPAEYKKEVKDFWKKYKNISPKWGWYYGYCNGIMDPRYIPNDLYYTIIDQHFNDRKLGWGFNDKNYYSKIFSGINQPGIVVRIINGLLFDENYKQISKEEAISLIRSEKEIVCKPALETGSGRGINFWKTNEDLQKIKDFLNDEESKDFVIQKVIKQNEELNKVHASSINTVRIMSLLMDDGVHILSSCLRMGVGGSRVDNVTAGGISCGIHDDGFIDKYAYAYYSGEKYEKHPSSGLVFEGFKVPSFDKAKDLVLKAHPLIGHFRLVSWDIAIEDDGSPLLIEANMRKGGINLHQFSNGPLFGDLTERVLNEVFHKK